MSAAIPPPHAAPECCNEENGAGGFADCEWPTGVAADVALANPVAMPAGTLALIAVAAAAIPDAPLVPDAAASLAAAEAGPMAPTAGVTLAPGADGGRVLVPDCDPPVKAPAAALDA